MHRYEWLTLRVVPQVTRGEFVNAGVVLFCPEAAFLRAVVELDVPRLLALDPTADPAAIGRHLAALVALCEGAPEAGPNGQRPIRERFRWLSAPRSTVVQPSPVHGGLTSEPASTLERLVEVMVRPVPPGERPR